MRARYLALVPILALALLPNLPAGAASTPTCFGEKADIVGTNKADTIHLTGAPGSRVAVTKGGNDVVTTDANSGRLGYLICTGDGRDKIVGPATKVHGGDGEDRWTFQLECEEWYSEEQTGFGGGRAFRVEDVIIERCAEANTL